MKTNLLLIFLIFSVSCSRSNYGNSVKSIYTGNYIYVLPINLETYIVDQIKKKKINGQDLYFLLQNIGEDYLIGIYPINNLEKEYYGFLQVIKTCRYVLIDDKTFPIVLGTDLIFGSKIDTITPLLGRTENAERLGEGIRRGPAPIIDYGIIIRFKKDGTILK